MLMQSGVGNSTAWPPGITQCLQGKGYTLYKSTFSISTYHMMYVVHIFSGLTLQMQILLLFFVLFLVELLPLFGTFFVSSFSILLLFFFLSKHFSLII